MNTFRGNEFCQVCEKAIEQMILWERTEIDNKVIHINELNYFSFGQLKGDTSIFPTLLKFLINTSQDSDESVYFFI